MSRQHRSDEVVTVMTSTWVSIWSFVIWLITTVIVAAIAPNEHEFFRMDFSEARGTIESMAVVQGIGNFAFLVGIVALIVTGFRKIMEKHTPQVTNVAGHNIRAGDKSIIATDQARVDQSMNVADSSFVLTLDHRNAVGSLVEHILASDLPELTKNHAKLLSETLHSNIDDDNADPRKSKNYLEDIVNLAERTKPTAKAILEGISLLRSTFEGDG